MTTKLTDGTLEDFLRKHGISSTAEPLASRDDGFGEDLPRHWRVTIRRGRRRMTLNFSQGSGHHAPPTTDDVIDCLASDAAGIENTTTFEDWCTELGYDTDSRKAERTYRAVERESAALKRVIGDTRIWQELLWETDRL